MTLEIEQEEIEQEEELPKLAGGIHGEIATTIIGYIFMHQRQKKTGRIFDSSTTFEIAPNQPKKEPDVAFVTLARLAQNVEVAVPIAPDFAVEVISSHDDWKELILKVSSYLQAGVALVWLVDPYTQSVFVFKPATGVSWQPRSGEDELEGEPVLPGFKLKVKDIFEGIDPLALGLVTTG